MHNIFLNLKRDLSKYTYIFQIHIGLTTVVQEDSGDLSVQTMFSVFRIADSRQMMYNVIVI